MSVLRAVEMMGVHWVTVHWDVLDHVPLHSRVNIAAVRRLTDQDRGEYVLDHPRYHGLVSSGADVAAGRRPGYKTIFVPGVRFPSASPDGHHLVISPQEISKLHRPRVDYAIVGRPIINAPDPVAAAARYAAALRGEEIPS